MPSKKIGQRQRKKNGTKRKRGGSGAARRPAGRAVAAVAARLDHGALAFRQLLLDPCNARFSSPTYSGLGSGNFVRRRVIIPAEGLSVEGTYVFQLGSGTYLKGSHVAATAGTAYTMSAVQMWSGGNNNSRCVAGCVKVRYIGSESARAGLISTLVAPALMYNSGVSTTAVGAAGVCPMTNRTGEVMHEIKFVPNEGDEQFGVPGTLVTDKSSLMVTYRGCPAQTIVFEVTAVLEIEAVSADGSTEQVINSVTPSSGNTLNQVLRSLGPVTNWAYTNVVAPTIRATASRLAGTGFSTSSAASLGYMALTL